MHINYLQNDTSYKELINYIKNSNYQNKKQVINYLNNKLKMHDYLFCDNVVFKNIFDIISTTKCLTLRCGNCILIAEEIYEFNTSLNPTEKEINAFYSDYKVILNFYNSINSFAVWEGLLDIVKIIHIYNLFKNKQMTKVLFSKLPDLFKFKNEEYTVTAFSNIDYNHESELIFSKVNQYIFKSKLYYADEITHIAAICNLIDYIYLIRRTNLKVKPFTSEQLDEIINNQLEMDKKQAGIYNIDEEKIKCLEQKCKELDDYYAKHLTQLQTLTDRTQEIEANINKLSDKGKQAKLSLNKITEKWNFNSVKPLEEIKNILKEYEEKICDNENESKESINDKNNIKLENNANKEIDNSENIRSSSVMKILEINPDFSLNHDHINYDWCCQETFDILGEEFIAFSNLQQQEMLSIAYNLNTLKIYKDIIDINPNFCAKDFGLIVDERIIKVFGKECIANADDDKQETIIYFDKLQALSILKKIWDLYDTNFCFTPITLPLDHKYEVLERCFVKELLDNCSYREIYEVLKSSYHTRFNNICYFASLAEKVCNLKYEVYYNDEIFIQSYKKIIKKFIKLDFQAKCDMFSEEPISLYQCIKESNKRKFKQKILKLSK